VILALGRRYAMTCQVIDALQRARNDRPHRQPSTQEPFMSVFASPRFFSRVMWADAASCAATAGLQLAFTDALASLTGLPASLLVGTGVFMLGYAAAAAAMAARSTPPRALIGLVVIGNFGWAAACVALLASGVVNATGIGMAWVLLQAVTVVILAELQWTGLRRTRAGAGIALA
jgi:hypothetical protein